MKKMVFKSSSGDESRKKKVLKMVAGTQGVDSLEVDVKEKKVTVIGEADPVAVLNRLRKLGSAELLSVAPAKEVKDWKKEGEKSQSNAKNKAESLKYGFVPLTPKYRPFEYTGPTDENPNACVIS